MSSMPDKSIEIAKLINPEVQTLVNELFEKSEASEKLRKENPEAYFAKSNQIFLALLACLSQRLLTDGLLRHKLADKCRAGIAVGWELFLSNNPEIAKKVAVDLAAKEAKYAAMEAQDDDGEDEEEQEDDEGSDDE